MTITCIKQNDTDFDGNLLDTSHDNTFSSKKKGKYHPASRVVAIAKEVGGNDFLDVESWVAMQPKKRPDVFLFRGEVDGVLLFGVASIISTYKNERTLNERYCNVDGRAAKKSGGRAATHNYFRKTITLQVPLGRKNEMVPALQLFVHETIEFHNDPEKIRSMPRIEREKEEEEDSDSDDDSTKKKKTGMWKNAEHERFLQGLDKHGKGKWVEISAIVKTRDRKQVAEHAKTYFKNLDAPPKVNVYTSTPSRRRVASSNSKQEVAKYLDSNDSAVRRALEKEGEKRVVNTDYIVSPNNSKARHPLGPTPLGTKLLNCDHLDKKKKKKKSSGAAKSTAAKSKVKDGKGAKTSSRGSVQKKKPGAKKTSGALAAEDSDSSADELEMGVAAKSRGGAKKKPAKKEKVLHDLPPTSPPKKPTGRRKRISYSETNIDNDGYDPTVDFATPPRKKRAVKKSKYSKDGENEFKVAGEEPSGDELEHDSDGESDFDDESNP